MDDINLHFTGDFHAIGAANNLLAAMVDNHIYQGNELNINPSKITWKRCVDMNDRQLRLFEMALAVPKMVFHEMMALILQLPLRLWQFFALLLLFKI